MGKGKGNALGVVLEISSQGPYAIYLIDVTMASLKVFMPQGGKVLSQYMTV